MRAPPPPLTAWKRANLTLVQLIHGLVILYLVFTPFLATSISLLILYIGVLLAIVMHWVANHHYCVLSLIESKLRGIDYEDGFLNSILKPIFGYGINNTGAYVAVVALLVLAIVRMVYLAKKMGKPRKTEEYCELGP